MGLVWGWAWSGGRDLGQRGRRARFFTVSLRNWNLRRYDPIASDSGLLRMLARSGQLRDRRHIRATPRVSTSRLVFSILVCVIFAAGTAAGTTKTGASIAASMQHFLTLYSGVFALVALTAAVAAGLAATDRIIMSPASRIVAQAVHRALAFVAVAFLATHILMEIMVGKSQVIDSVVPFISPGQKFYIGLGTVASDLTVLIVATGIARRRFAERASPVAWRVLHGTAYLAWPLSVVHGLVAGRQPRPYVSWSYGACMIAVGLALVLRSVATLRPRQAAAQVWPDDDGSSLHAAARAAAQAYLEHSQQRPLPVGVRADTQIGGAVGLAAGVPGGFAAGVPGGFAAAGTPSGGFPAHTPPGGFPGHTPTGDSPGHTPAGGFPGHTPARGFPAQPPAGGFSVSTPPGGFPASVPPASVPPAGVRAHAPAQWVRNQTPAEGLPVPPHLASVPYQVQSLHPAHSDEDPARWAAE